MEDEKFLGDELRKIIGAECSSVIVGKGTGSVINMGFGKMKKRSRAVANYTLSELDREYEAERSILVYSAWRVIRGGIISHGWRDAMDERDKLYEKMRNLVGKKVVDIEFDSVTKDIRISFNDRSEFNILCDMTSEYDGDENYIFYSPTHSYSVELHGHIVKNERKPTSI